MKATEIPINAILVLLLILAVLAIAIYTAFGQPSIADRGISALEQRKFDNQKADQLKELNGYYSSFMKTGGGLDSYEASFLIAKVIEYTWRDCNGFCSQAGDIPEFTRFFADHPIILLKKLDCQKEYEYEKGEIYEIWKLNNLNNIRGMCSKDDLGVDKTERVDEWTVTAWGLQNTLCKNFIVEGKQWGNGYCANGVIIDDADITKYKCADFCAKAGFTDKVHEITSDRIKAWDKTLELGKSYSNIKITYSPDCTLLAGKICNIWGIGGVICFFNPLKQSCSMVEIGEGTTSPTAPAYSSTNSCYYGSDCIAQNPPINPPYESQCPAFFSYDGGNGATVCLYGKKCCGSETYCAEILSGGAAPTPGGCVQEKCWYKNSQVCTGGETCSTKGCV